MSQIATPISDEEALEFAARMMGGSDLEVNVEAVRASIISDRWERFVETRLLVERGQYITEGQQGVLERGRAMLVDLLPSAGITFGLNEGLRGPRAWFRDARGRFVSFDRVASELSGLTRSIKARPRRR